jgi:5-formyltetrahydrofolate cyclo-ligase
MTIPVGERPALRREMRARRRALSPGASARASVAIVQHLLRLEAFRRARSVAGYWPVGGEPDILEALLIVHARGATALLPVLDRRGAANMRFARWQPGGPLTRNRYGIPEPANGNRRFYRPLDVDLVVAPVVAFDSRGHRLGQGGGYYDRAFAAAIGRHRPWAPLVGVAYDHQRVPSLEVAPWDVSLDLVVTEKSIWRCRRGDDPPAKAEPQTE